MKKKILLIPVFCICLSLIASSCEDLTVPPPPPPPLNDHYRAIILHTGDAGGTWQVNDLKDNSGQYYTSVQCITSLSGTLSNLFVITSNNYLLKSTDLGANWLWGQNQSTYPLASITRTPTEGEGYLVGYFTERTTNFGSTWSYVQLNEINNYIAAAFFNELKGILIPHDPGDTTYLTTNGGLNWIFGPVIPTGNFINAIKPVSSTEAVICANSGTILRTTDAGSTWTQINSPTTENLVSIEFSDPVGIIVGDHGTILRTVDGGYFWQIVPSEISKNLKKVYHEPGSLWWAVGDNIILQSGSGALWGTVRSSATEYYRDIFIIKGEGFAVGVRGL